eukprot:gene15587-21054_t
MDQSKAFTCDPPDDEHLPMEEFPDDDVVHSDKRKEDLKNKMTEIMHDCHETQDKLQNMSNTDGSLPFNQIFYLHEEEIGVPSDLTKTSDILEYLMKKNGPLEKYQSFISKEWTLLHKAWLHWTMLGPSRSLIDDEMNFHYETLYQGMIEHASKWNNYWEDNSHYMWCERSVGIINSYATVIRQRAELLQAKNYVLTEIKTEQILNQGNRLLTIYKRMLYATDNGISTQVDRDASIDCLKGLTYKFIHIKHNLLNQTNRMDSINPSELRFMMVYEIDEYILTESEDGHGNRCVHICLQLDIDTTHSAIANVSNKQIKEAYLLALIDKRKLHPLIVAAMTRVCGGCGLFETQHGDYKMCGNCRVEYYCSPECQKKAWKTHKLLCGKC